MKILLSLLTFITTILQILHAQPGGGGGIQIMNVLVPDATGFKTISKKDTSLKINAYFLALNINKDINSIARNRALNNYDKYDFAGKVFTHIYLPPHYLKDGKTTPAPNQRLELIYKGDTMTLDFFGVIPENGSGRTDQIDTISFYSGTYFKCYRNVEAKIARYYPGTSTGNRIRPGELDSIRRLMQMGITYHTLRALEKYELLQQFNNKPAMTIFLRQEKYDTVWLQSFPIYNLELKNINIQSNKINIRADEDAVLVNNQLIYKFYLGFTPTLGFTEKNEGQEKVRLLFTQLKTIPLEINGHQFTGTIKWLTPFRNNWYSGVSLSIHTFSHGVLVKEEIRYDVHPQLERELERPTGH